MLDAFVPQTSSVASRSAILVEVTNIPFESRLMIVIRFDVDRSACTVVVAAVFRLHTHKAVHCNFFLVCFRSEAVQLTHCSVSEAQFRRLNLNGKYPKPDIDAKRIL